MGSDNCVLDALYNNCMHMIVVWPQHIHWFLAQASLLFVSGNQRLHSFVVSLVFVMAVKIGSVFSVKISQDQEGPRPYCVVGQENAKEERVA